MFILRGRYNFFKDTFHWSGGSCQKNAVHENELYSKIVHKLLATNFTIWPNSNSQKTTKRIQKLLIE